jgi:hypothetical protein
LQTPVPELNNILKLESEMEVLFYLKVSEKRHSPPEYRFEIVTSISDGNISTTADDRLRDEHAEHSDQFKQSSKDKNISPVRTKRSQESITEINKKKRK